MERRRLHESVAVALGSRQLVWGGLRGEDAESIADLPQFSASFSIVGAYGARPTVESVAYEDLSGVRPDLDAWDIDEHLEVDATTQFRHGLLRALSSPSALLPYRPSRFLSAIWFARQDRCLNLGLFGAHQAAFEHKPWIETEIDRLGIPRIPWTYIADEEQLRGSDLLREGPVMLRPSRSSGGAGLVKVDSIDELRLWWPRGVEAFASVAPFLSDALPLNVGGTVWADGVTVHHPSIQLIGIHGCVTRPFGYCGNDFGAARDLDRQVVDAVEDATVRIGGRLATHGYRGTFGVDFLVYEGTALFTEVNPRFQGSTQASSLLAIESGEACLVLEHIAAILGMPAPPRRPLADIAREMPDLATLVIHWTGETSTPIDPSRLRDVVHWQAPSARLDVLTRPTFTTDPGGVVARVTVRERLTSDGYTVAPNWQTLVEKWRDAPGAIEFAEG